MKQCLVYAVLAFAALGTPDLFCCADPFHQYRQYRDG